MTATKQIRTWIISLLVFIILLYVLRGVLTPFIAGMAVAYFVDPIADKLEEWGMSRTAATASLTFAFFVIALGGLSVLLPALTSQVTGFASRVPLYFAQLQTWAEPLLAQILSGMSENDFKELTGSAASVAKHALGAFSNIVQRLISGGSVLVNLVTLIVLTPLVTFYMLRDWDVLVARIDSWLPRKHVSVIREQCKLIDETLAGFVRGQASVCFILGTFYAIGLSILGLEFGLLVGLGAGLISFIPYFGSIVGFGVSMAIAVTQFSDMTQIGLVAGVFVVGQVLEGNFLTPKLVGEKVGLHPVWVIFALMAGGALAGFTGVMLAVPIAAVIGVLVRFGLAQYLKSALYSDTPSDQT